MLTCVTIMICYIDTLIYTHRVIKNIVDAIYCTS